MVFHQDYDIERLRRIYEEANPKKGNIVLLFSDGKKLWPEVYEEGLYDSYFSVFPGGKLQDISERFGVPILDFHFIANHNLANLFIPER